MRVVSIFVELLGDYEDVRHLRQRLSRIHFSLDATPISRDCGGEIQKAMSLAENLCFQLQCPAHALRIIIGLLSVLPSIVY
jgi:hypothetical protein